MEHLIELKDVYKIYQMGEETVHALDGISLTVDPGEFVAIVGSSGSGKSTLLHMMGGLDTPTSGSVMVRDKELAKMNDEQLTIFRRRNIGFIFQNYNLVPILNVHENIVLPVELDGDTVDQKFMADVVSMLGLEDKLKNMPNNLSGGQQQRVAIARALVSKPAIVLADEPTGNLDSRTSADVLGLLQRTSREFNQTLVMITHNDAIAQLADRIVRIEDGKIVDAKFKTFGCGAAVATSSMATELVKGKSIQEALEVTNKAVMEALDGLPPVKVHCSCLAEEALRAALWDYAQKNNIVIDGLEPPVNDVDERHHQAE